MRQAAEDDVDRAEIDLARRDETRQRGEHGEMRPDIGHPLPRLGVGRQRDDLDIGMPEREADKVGPGIARCPEDGDADGGHDGGLGETPICDKTMLWTAARLWQTWAGHTGDDVQNTIGLLVVLLIVGAILTPLLDGKGGSARVRAKPLMTAREVKFWRLLIAAAGPMHVAPQVAMGALMKVDGAAGRSRARATRNRFDRKVVDFVLLDDDGAVRLLIELDDRMHDSDRDTARDKMTAQAGYQTLRVNGAAARDLHLLKAAIGDRLGLAPSWSPPAFDPATTSHRARRW